MQPLYIIAHHCRPSARLLYREARNRANMRPQKAARGRAKATQEVEEVTIVAETQAQGEEAVVKKEKKEKAPAWHAKDVCLAFSAQEQYLTLYRQERDRPKNRDAKIAELFNASAELER